MSSSKDLEESEVAARLNLSVLVSRLSLDILNGGLVEVLLSWPLKSFSPSLVSEPVADKVSITGVDQYWDLLQDAWDNTVEWLHPITLEQEVTVDIEVARIIAADFDTKLGLNFTLVQELADPSKCRVAEVVGVLALTTDIIDVLSSLALDHTILDH